MHFKNTREVGVLGCHDGQGRLHCTVGSTTDCACLTPAEIRPLCCPAPLQAAFSLRKMELNKAKKYLEDVLGHKRAIPFRRYSGNVGRTAQAKNEGAPAGQARWPAKSCEFLLNLLKNAESNAEVQAECACARSEMGGMQYWLQRGNGRHLD